jgi:agmatine/peptidylarginine deiminase
MVLTVEFARILRLWLACALAAVGCAAAAGGNPDHPNITWHRIANENAWMRDNGPVYVVQDGAMRLQDWRFDAWGGACGNIPDATAANLEAAGFQVIRMDFEAEISYGGSTFDADYMNWGVGNGWVILVGFANLATDNAAKALLESW